MYPYKIYQVPGVTVLCPEYHLTSAFYYQEQIVLHYILQMNLENAEGLVYDLCIERATSVLSRFIPR